MGMIGKVKLNSPAGGRIKNPLTENRGDSKKLKKHHSQNLGVMGMKSPKSPLK